MGRLTFLLGCLLWATSAAASLQPIPGFSASSLDVDATEFAGPMGGSSWTGTEASRFQLVPAAGVFSRFAMTLDTAPDNGAGTQSFTFTVRTGSSGGALSDTNITCVVSETNTFCMDNTHTVTVSAGDRISIKVVPTVSDPALGRTHVMMIFSPTTADQVILMGGASTSQSQADTQYHHIFGISRDGNEDDKFFILAEAGTIAFLTVEVQDPPNGAGKQWAMHIRDCGQWDGALVCGNSAVGCNIDNAETGCNSGASTVAMVAGDVFTIQVNPDNTPDLLVSIHFGIRYDMTTANTFVLSAATDSNLDDNNTTFGPIAAGDFGTTTEEARFAVLMPFVETRSIYFWASVDAGSAPDEYDVFIRGDLNQDGSRQNTDCTTSITGTSNTGSKTNCNDRIHFAFAGPTFSLVPNNTSQTVSMDSAWGFGFLMPSQRRKTTIH